MSSISNGIIIHVFFIRMDMVRILLKTNIIHVFFYKSRRSWNRDREDLGWRFDGFCIIWNGFWGEEITKGNREKRESSGCGSVRSEEIVTAFCFDWEIIVKGNWDFAFFFSKTDKPIKLIPKIIMTPSFHNHNSILCFHSILLFNNLLPLIIAVIVCFN